MGWTSQEKLLAHARVEGSIFSDPCPVTVSIFLKNFKLLSSHILISIYLILIHPSINFIYSANVY